MKRGRVAVLCVVAAAWAWACAAAVAPAAQNAKQGKGNAAKDGTLEAAVAELRREYAAYQKDPDAAPLRELSDFFVDRVLDAPPATVIAALERPVVGERVEGAYVKWQLLSALPETLDPPEAKRLIAAYQKAPLPSPRYGLSPDEKRKLDRALLRARPQDDVELTQKVEAAVERAAAAERPVLAYRDELYRRLPPGRDKVVAGLRDAHERLGVASPTKGLMEAVADDLQAWALSGGAQRAQVREVAELVGKLRLVEGPPYYASAAVRRGRLGWVVKRDPLMPKKKFAELHELLLETAGVAAPPDPAAKAGRKGQDKNKAGPDP